MVGQERQVIARGSGPDDTTWTVVAFGDNRDYHTLIRVEGRDRSLGEGGMGGPPLYPNEPLNVYRGLADHGPQRLLVRADPRAERLRVHFGDGSALSLRCAARVPVHGVVVFAALLPREQEVRMISAEDAAGNTLA
jgi:hypothetical protein